MHPFVQLIQHFEPDSCVDKQARMFGQNTRWKLQTYDLDCQTVLVVLQDFMEFAAHRAKGVEAARCVINTTEQIEDQFRRKLENHLAILFSDDTSNREQREQ